MKTKGFDPIITLIVFVIAILGLILILAIR